MLVNKNLMTAAASLLVLFFLTGCATQVQLSGCGQMTVEWLDNLYQQTGVLPRSAEKCYLDNDLGFVIKVSFSTYTDATTALNKLSEQAAGDVMDTGLSDAAWITKNGKSIFYLIRGTDLYTFTMNTADKAVIDGVIAQYK